VYVADIIAAGQPARTGEMARFGCVIRVGADYPVTGVQLARMAAIPATRWSGSWARGPGGAATGAGNGEVRPEFSIVLTARARRATPNLA
jgi:hypothetical protein